MSFENFTEAFGSPRDGSAVDLSALELDDHNALRGFADVVGAGIFGDGFLSLLSVREAVGGLYGWEQWLPDRSRLFGCTAFGTLLVTSGKDIWIVDTQYGQVVESDFSMERFIDSLATDSVRELFRADLFHRWLDVHGWLEPTAVLCPTPVLALGGGWSVETLSSQSLPAYLSFTSQLFGGDDAADQVEVRRAG